MSEFETVKVAASVALATPSCEFFRENGVYAYSSLIPETRTHAKRVYFVSGSNGDEFGQFSTKELAFPVAAALAKLSESERQAFDL